MTDETQDQPSSPARRAVGRRDLLKIGATSAVLPAVLGPATVTDKRKPAGDSAKRELPAGPFSVGYWNGHPDSPLGSARSLLAGDPGFVRYGARLEMLGMASDMDPATFDRLQSLAVDIDMGAAPYRAWRFENAIVRNVSSPNAFSVPVDAKNGIMFSVEAVAAGLKGIPRAGGFRLSVGAESSVPKLQQGYYVIAIGERGRGLRVNWASYELVGDSTGQSISLHRNGKPVTDFPYVLFSVSLDRKSTTTYV
jgi:hypothetical protein